MKISEKWLREWIDPPVSTDELARQLTMAGVEVDGIEDATADFTGVVVGEVLEVTRHPDADQLSVCRVDAGTDAPLNVVCGAPNVHAGMRSPTALVGARLPGGIKVRKTKLRGVESQGMLCSVAELGLGDEADGIMSLPEDAEVGTDLREYLAVADSSLELKLTPNRGDCLGLIGVARELGVINRIDFGPIRIPAVPSVAADTFSVTVDAPEACPRFAGRVIRNIRTGAVTPLWMQEKLRRSGLRPIHPVVDVTNYVMLELGQPLHGYDLRRLTKGIVVRFAEQGEKLTLLDGREIELDADVLVIADGKGAHGLAGIMGGADSGVADDTRDVFFEAAFFSPHAIAGRPRRYGLHTDASKRFERGVDPQHQERAIERATALLLEIAGGEAGPLTVVSSDKHVPARPPVRLRRERITTVLGVPVPDDEICEMLRRLEMRIETTPEGWAVTPPGFRFDITIEEDLIEEVARIYGYDKVPEANAAAHLVLGAHTEKTLPLIRAKEALVDRGYQEAITYSLVPPELQAQFAPEATPLVLQNPISADMSEMRVSLWPGLVMTCEQNQKRQQERVRIFESGLRFILQDDEIKQENMLAGLVAGRVDPEQWGTGKGTADFFDIKRDVEAILRLTGQAAELSCVADSHPALRRGQSARIQKGNYTVGWLGALHPEIARRLDLTYLPLLFELAIEQVFVANVPAFAPISKYPSVRRDIAVIVDEAVTSAELKACVKNAAGELLQELRIFDIYRGKGIETGRKSVALGLILQEFSRTLTVQDADAVITAVVTRLERDMNATIRD